LPVQRGNVRVSKLVFLNAILYTAENGCKWRKLPKEFGSWHTIYMRMRRWVEHDIWPRVLDALRSELTESHDLQPIVPPKSHCIGPWEYDVELYKRRNEVERFFRRLKAFRRVFTRYDKLDIMYASFVDVAVICDFLRKSWEHDLELLDPIDAVDCRFAVKVDVATFGD
jgi:transposase